MSDDQETEATEQVVNHGRRSAMKKITLGVGVLAGLSALPEQWTRPIIGQIVLPAHAATSGSTLHDPCAVELRGGDNTTATVIIKVTGFVTPPVANLPVTITATAVGGANQKVEAKAATSATGTFEVIMTIGGGPGITSVNVSTSVAGADGVANCVVHTTTTTAAAPAGVCSDNSSLPGTWVITYSAVGDYIQLSLSGAATWTRNDQNGSWTRSGDVLTIILYNSDETITYTFSGTLTSCVRMAGTRVKTGIESGETSFTADKGVDG